MRRSNEYAVDLVLCIDVTGSMYPIVEQVKQGALTFPKRLEESMAVRDKAMGRLRVRVVAYRDFRDNPADALQESPFLGMPDQVGEFDSLLRDLQAGGGGDEPESGLEALAVALRSDWDQGPGHRRHIVVLLTDASAHPLGVGNTAATYPTSVPATVDDLMKVAEGAVGLVMFAPKASPWDAIASEWGNTVRFAARPGGGLNEYAFDEIIEAIAGGV